MNRRSLIRAAAAIGVTPLLPVRNTMAAGRFTGKIRKSLKWSMVQKAADGMSMTDAFKKLRTCG
ncbi:MAG: hypothetical protein KDK97_21070, partial [Verrucomicrobiales bacterium]|nr:hypothetical protein [Verrucomicrobiales bacterium]